MTSHKLDDRAQTALREADGDWHDDTMSEEMKIVYRSRRTVVV